MASERSWLKRISEILSVVEAQGNVLKQGR